MKVTLFYITILLPEPYLSIIEDPVEAGLNNYNLIVNLGLSELKRKLKMQTAYIGIAIASLAIIFGIFVLRSRQKPSQPRKPSTLALIGMLLVVLAIVAGENR